MIATIQAARLRKAKELEYKEKEKREEEEREEEEMEELVNTMRRKSVAREEEDLMKRFERELAALVMREEEEREKEGRERDERLDSLRQMDGERLVDVKIENKNCENELHIEYKIRMNQLQQDNAEKELKVLYDNMERRRRAIAEAESDEYVEREGSEREERLDKLREEGIERLGQVKTDNDNREKELDIEYKISLNKLQYDGILNELKLLNDNTERKRLAAEDAEAEAEKQREEREGRVRRVREKQERLVEVLRKRHREEEELQESRRKRRRGEESLPALSVPACPVRFCTALDWADAFI